MPAKEPVNGLKSRRKSLVSEFIPPRMEHVVIDEETQMQRYLAEIAMEDLLLLSGKRREWPGGLMAQYRRTVAERGGVTDGMGIAPEDREITTVDGRIMASDSVVVDFEG